jgi:PAS domain-containing protein
MISKDYICALLDSMDVAVCGFDHEHRTAFWNRTFLDFFPEHAEFVRVGEPYADNLRRFYMVRLDQAEWGNIERFIAEGVARHAQQQQPFEFTHHGRRLQVASLPAPDGGRVRVWRAASRTAGPIPDVDSLETIPDGATILDPKGRLLVCNETFRKLYDLPAHVAIVGLTIAEIVAACWRGVYAVGRAKISIANDRRDEQAIQASVLNALRYDGAAFEVELPGARWRRVISRHDAAGVAYAVHSDITAIKRQQHDLEEAQAALQEAQMEIARLRLERSSAA